MEALFDLSERIILALQSMSPALDGVMHFFSFLGAFEGYLLLLPFIYWNINPKLGIRVLLLLLGTDVLGDWLKIVLGQPRPYWLGGVKGLASASSYGIPSGHASSSLAVWGYLAFSIRQRWLWIAAGVLVLMIGISRMYLGVHFLHDVLAGWLLGGLTMAWVIRNAEVPAAWWRQLGMIKLPIAFVISAAIVLFGLLGVAISLASPDPVAFWTSLAVEARSPAPFFLYGGVFFGGVAGYELMRSYAAFQVPSSLRAKILCYVVGMAGVLLLWKGLDGVFARLAADETTAGLLLRYVRYAATGFWAIFGAPWLFLRMRWANPA